METLHCKLVELNGHTGHGEDTHQVTVHLNACTCVPSSDSETYLRATLDKVDLACVSTCTWPVLWPAMFSSVTCLRSSVVVEVKAVLLHYTLTD